MFKGLCFVFSLQFTKESEVPPFLYATSTREVFITIVINFGKI